MAARATFILLANLILFGTASAGKFGEHKEIGDSAFAQAVRTIKAKPDSSPLVVLAGIVDSNLCFKAFDRFVKMTYGDITALSGDHVTNPLILQDALLFGDTRLGKSAKLQHQYLGDGFLDAPDEDLFSIDPSYATNAISDLSHFYDYGESFYNQLPKSDSDEMGKFQTSQTVKTPFATLSKTNSITKYVTLHSFALQLAYYAGQLYQEYQSNAEESLVDSCTAVFQNALFVEGFGEHFIQDAFSAGHLVVKRSAFQPFYDKELHDFYGKVGLEVFNLRGERWYAFGDGYMRREERYSYATQVIPYSQNFAYAIEASKISLLEIFREFQRGRQQLQELKELAQKEESRQLFYLRNFEALRIIPVPFHTDLALFDSLKDSAPFDQYYKKFETSKPEITRRNQISGRQVVGAHLGTDFYATYSYPPGGFIHEYATSYVVGGGIVLKGFGFLSAYENMLAKNDLFSYLNPFVDFSLSFQVGMHRGDVSWFLPKAGVRVNFGIYSPVDLELSSGVIFPVEDRRKMYSTLAFSLQIAKYFSPKTDALDFLYKLNPRIGVAYDFSTSIIKQGPIQTFSVELFGI